MLNKNENIHGPFLINVFQTCPSSASSTNEGLQWDAKLCLNSTHLCSLHPPEEPMCINDATTHGYGLLVLLIILLCSIMLTMKKKMKTRNLKTQKFQFLSIELCYYFGFKYFSLTFNNHHSQAKYNSVVSYKNCENMNKCFQVCRIQHNRTMEELRYRQQTELREAETKNKKRLEIAVSKLRKRDEERRKEREMIYEEVDQMD